MVAQNMVGHTQVVMRHDLQGEISERLSDGEGRPDSTAPSWSPFPYNIGTYRRRPAPAAAGRRGLGEGGSLAEVVEHRPEFPECHERIPQVEPEVDGLLLRGAAFQADA